MVTSEPSDPDTPLALGEQSEPPANERCVFCRILRGTSPGEILLSDDQLFCIRDIHPVSTHHILVIPKEHLPNPAHLRRDQLPLLSQMERLGLQAVQNLGGSVNRNDVIMGLHWPPFCSQQHLHLHIISPKEQLSWFGKIAFWPGAYWFVTSQWMRERLENL